MIFRMSALSLIAACALAACANKYEVVTPDLQASMMTDLRTGKMTLDCDLKCKLPWEMQAASIHAYDLAENWQTLAVRVMQVGYGSDLAYYYLGQAAQGLGYHQAAIGYYSQSLALATGLNPFTKCAAGRTDTSDPCQGVDIVSSIPVLIQASRDEQTREAEAAQAVADATPAPVKPHHHRKIAAKSNNGSDWVAPPPPTSDGQSSSDWAAPPPPTSK